TDSKNRFHAVAPTCTVASGYPVELDELDNGVHLGGQERFERIVAHAGLSRERLQRVPCKTALCPALNAETAIAVVLPIKCQTVDVLGDLARHVAEHVEELSALWVQNNDKRPFCVTHELRVA